MSKTATKATKTTPKPTKKTSKGNAPKKDKSLTVNGIEFTPMESGKQGQKYGIRNAVTHGRFSQGGLIDQFLIRSIKNGKPFTLKDINLQREKDNEERVIPCNLINTSRLADHIEHLKGKHNMVVNIGTDKGIKHYIATYTPELVNGKGENVTKEDLLKGLLI